ncbi:MAG TPA: TfoX/Sxy family protein [Acidimicrobiales bacterium]|nr:TfoX/Sxy family protein [Acidimicrobiales bacterium]
MGEEEWEQLQDRFAGAPGVTLPGESARRGFGRHALKVDGSIFAMWVRGHLVVKLPQARVDALVADGDAVRFDANKGTPMKEWAVIHVEDPAVWAALADEALAFVRRR